MTPQLFRHAGGIGVMAEAGPEAVMPLLRSGGGFAVGAKLGDGREMALPLTRLGSGRLGVELAPKPFAFGGVFDGPVSSPVRLPAREGSSGDAHGQAVRNEWHFHNETGAPIRARVSEERPDGQGGMRTDVLLEAMVSEALKRPRTRKASGLPLNI
jgi:hypothetical protein